MNWQPIETAPKDGTFVLVWRGSNDSRRWPPVVVAQYQEEKTFTWEGGNKKNVHLKEWRAASTGMSVGQPTHWMPLPPDPQTGPGGEEC